MAQGTEKLKKIEVIESGNQLLDKRYRVMPLADSINSPGAIALRAFAEENGLVRKEQDIDFILEMLRWVSSRWTHDGNNSAEGLTSLQILRNAKEGKRYRCVEYGTVMASVLRSYGFLSRTAGLKTKDAPYGKPGSGHFATEVWVDDLRKWIFLDPQNCIYTKYKGQFLNYYDIYRLHKQGLFDKIEFIISKGYTGYLAMGVKSAQAHILLCKQFLHQFFGSMDIPIRLNGKDLRLALSLDNKQQYFTFQGMPHYGDLVFARDSSDLYFPLNQNTMIFGFADGNKAAVQLGDLIKNKVINTQEEQFKYMNLYAPEPRLLVYNDNNMPYFDHYELTLNGEQIKMNDKGFFEVNLQEGINEIKCVAVNRNGKRGSVNIVKVRYGI